MAVAYFPFHWTFQGGTQIFPVVNQGEMAVRMDAIDLGRDGQYPWPMTQAEIGDALGLSVVHVNRTLQELRGTGLITLKGGTLIIHDWDGLKRAGEFTPEYPHLSGWEPRPEEGSLPEDQRAAEG